MPDMTFIKLFVDYLDAIEPLGDAERGRLFTALLEYTRTGEAPQLGGNERFLFPMMKAQIDRDIAAFTEKESQISESRREAGRRGGLAKASKSSKSKQNLANVANVAKASKSSKSKQNLANVAKDKDKDEDKDYKTICSEPPPDGGTSERQGVAALPLNDKSFYYVSPEQAVHWQELFPAVDVEQELRSMVAWCEANPQKRKTRGGVERFIIAWLAKRQDRGGSAPLSGDKAARQGSPGSAFPDYTNREGSL